MRAAESDRRGVDEERKREKVEVKVKETDEIATGSLKSYVSSRDNKRVYATKTEKPHKII